MKIRRPGRSPDDFGRNFDAGLTIWRYLCSEMNGGLSDTRRQTAAEVLTHNDPATAWFGHVYVDGLFDGVTYEDEDRAPRTSFPTREACEAAIEARLVATGHEVVDDPYRPRAALALAAGGGE